MLNMKKLVVFISIAAVAGGCSVYRTYERPDLPVIDSLYQSPQPAGSADTVSLAALSWKELFTDEPLQQLIETGLRNNVDLEVARLKVAEAEAMLRSSKLAYLPSVSLAPQGSVSRPENAGTARSYDLANGRPRRLWKRAKPIVRRCRRSLSRRLPTATIRC